VADSEAGRSGGTPPLCLQGLTGLVLIGFAARTVVQCSAIVYEQATDPAVAAAS